MANFKINSGHTFNIKNVKTDNSSNSKDLMRFKDQVVEITDLLVYCSETNCSDLYIKVGVRPYISRFGKIVELPCVPTTEIEWSNFADNYISSEANAEYVRNKMLDTAIEVRIPDDSPFYGKYDSNYFRYRASFGFSQNKNTATFRMIKPESPSFSTINYPVECKNVLHKALNKKTGITMFTGPTGSGKTTSLVACMNDFTKSGEILDNKMIITLEDPIEYVFNDTQSVRFMQKELGKDFKSFALGIKQALREHPNMVNVGECRDKEVIVAAIEACRTGHGVVTSFHAADVPGTIARMSFYLDDKDMIYDLIINLNLIISQRLEPSNDRYVVKTQFMLFNDDITKQILAILDSGKNISVEIEKMFHDPNLISQGLVKDWS